MIAAVMMRPRTGPWAFQPTRYQTVARRDVIQETTSLSNHTVAPPRSLFLVVPVNLKLGGNRFSEISA